MRALTLLLLAALPCWAQEPPQSTLSQHRPCETQSYKGTGVPALDDLLREAKRDGAVKYRQFQEADGSKRWYRASPDGYLRRLPPAEVAAPDPFRAGSDLPPKHADHRCPSCHYESPPNSGTWIVRGWNRDGTHTHSCPKCGASWRH